MSNISFNIFSLLMVLTTPRLISNDSIHVVNSLSNSLYLGIDNKIIFPDTLKDESAYLFKTGNGNLFRDSNVIYVIPSRLPDLHISVFHIQNSDTVEILKRRFFVKYVPRPCIIIANQCIEELQKMSRQNLINSPEIALHISDDIVGAQDWYKIKRISLGYVFGSVYRSFETDGNKLSDEMLEAVKRINPGEQISIRVSVESHGGLIKSMPICNLIIY